MPAINKVFSINLRRLRESKNLTQTDLANSVGLSRQSIARYESGKGGATLDTIAVLAKFFEVEETDLVKAEKSIERVSLPREQWESLVAFRPLPKQEQLIPDDLLSKLSQLDEKSRNKLFKIWNFQIDAGNELKLKDGT